MVFCHPTAGCCHRAEQDTCSINMKHVADDAPVSTRRARYVLFTFFALLAGAVLLQNLHGRFVFRYAESWTHTVLWSLLLLTPFILFRLKRAPLFAARLAKRYPSTWVRDWLVMPLMASMLAGLVLAGPLGWMLAVAAWSDGTVRHVSATAVEVGAYSARKGCDQSATLRFASVDKETCLDSLYPPASMQRGQRLDVGITAFAFGFLIVSIAATDAADAGARSPDAAQAE